MDRKVRAAAPALRSPAEGVLRVNISPMLAGHVSSLVGEYATIHPQASFELSTADRSARLVASGFDLWIRADPPSRSRLVTRRIGFVRFVLCTSPSYLARHGMPRGPQDLGMHNCLTPASGERWRFLGSAGRYPVPVSGSLTSDNPEVLRIAALSGQGVALLPEMSLWDDLSAGRLVRLLRAHSVEDAEVYAVFPWRPSTLVQVLRFVDFAAERFGPYQQANTDCRAGHRVNFQPGGSRDL